MVLLPVQGQSLAPAPPGSTQSSSRTSWGSPEPGALALLAVHNLQSSQGQDQPPAPALHHLLPSLAL